jgi:hypothetical protein
MRRVIFILLVIAVLGVIAFFGWREFRVPTINFVTDTVLEINENHFAVKRLYSAEIDQEAYDEALGSMLVLTEYEEDERFQAALAAGRPSFIPTFNFVAASTNYLGEGEVWVDGYITMSVAEGQTERRFRMGTTYLEAVTQGDLTIERFELFALPGSGTDPLPMIHSDTQAAVDITGQARFRVAMTGREGMLTLQFVYNVDVETPLILTVQEERLLQVHLLLSVNDFGILTTTFVAETYDSLEQLLETNAEGAE